MIHIDLTPLVGLSGAPTVMKIVDYVKSMGLPSTFAPLAALAFGIVFNVVLALLIGSDLRASLPVGFLTGLFASGWYEKTK